MPQWFWTQGPVIWMSAALCAASVLIVAGWRGRRIGRELCCRRCGYAIQDLPTERCPECGLEDAKRRPRKGFRQRSWLLVGVGAATLLSVGGPAIWMLRDANWRVAAPTMVLGVAVNFGDGKAADEILARVAANTLSAATLREVAAQGLSAQAEAPLESARLAHWMTVLAALDERDLLTDPEWERMIQQCVREMDVRVRERTRVGDLLPVEVTVRLAAPQGTSLSGALRLAVEGELEREAVVDELSLHSRPFDSRPSDRRESQLLLKQQLNPWTRAVDVEMDASVRLFGWGGGQSVQIWWPSARPPLPAPAPAATGAIGRWRNSGCLGVSPPAGMKPLPRVKLRCTRSIRVCAGGGVEDLERVQGAEVRAALTKLVDFGFARVDYGVGGARTIRTCEEPIVRLRRPAPWPLAFEAYLFQGGERVLWGRISARAGAESFDTALDRNVLGELKRGGITLRLEPLPDVGRRSIDIRFVDEVIELGPLEFVPRVSAAARSADVEFRHGVNAIRSPTAR